MLGHLDADSSALSIRITCLTRTKTISWSLLGNENTPTKHFVFVYVSLVSIHQEWCQLVWLVILQWLSNQWWVSKVYLVSWFLLISWKGYRDIVNECFFSYYTLVQLNEDLVGHIDFLAQTGPFSVPIRCVTKKCQVKFFNIFIVVLV